MSIDPTDSDSILPRDLVAQRFAVPASMLVRYEARGLVRSVHREGIVGYERAEIRRIWTVVSLQRDLGINLAGVEAVVKLRAQLDNVHSHLEDLASRLRAALDEKGSDESP